MKYKQAEQFIFSLVNSNREKREEKEKICGSRLQRLQYFLNILGNPEKTIPHYIHVTGTSGKGSVCAFLQSIIHASGKKTGLLQSPYPTYMAERWQINNQTMFKKDFIKIIELIKPKLKKHKKNCPYGSLTYSELMMAITLLYFAKQKVQWAVIEAGCGGRRDATNIIPYKDAAIITNIGSDHRNIIGPTKKDIAYEKAGIIKSGCKAFTGEKNKKMLNIINAECEIQNVELIKINNKQLTINNCGLTSSTFKYKNKKNKINAPGKHQVDNATLAITTAQALNFPGKAIKEGLKSARQPLRMEVVSKQPLIILDGAHNPEKIKAAVNTLKTENSPARTRKRLHLLVGFSDNKEWKKMIRILAKLKPATVACVKNTINPFRQATDPKKIAAEFKKGIPKTNTKIFRNPPDALNWSKKQAKKKGILLITGSIFLSGELRPELTKTK